MRWIALVALVATPVWAQSGLPPEGVQQRAEQVSKAVIRGAYGDAAGPAANCLRDHASGDELRFLGSLTGCRVDAARVAVVRVIHARAAAQACIRSNNVRPRKL